MIEVPSFCDNCGTIFPSGIVVSNCMNLTLSNNKSRCPNCGGWGHAIDGVFNIINDSIEILSGPQITVERLDKLEKIFKSSERKKSSPEEIEDTIKKEVPELSKISDIMPKKRTEFYEFIKVMILILQFIISTSNNGGVTKAEPHQVINYFYQCNVTIESTASTKSDD
jgi:PHP family Zn ribbon phosphoesterase